MHKRACAALTAVLLTGVAGLSGCVANRGSVAPGVASAPAAAVELASLVPQIAVPPASIGQWHDLGVYQAPWLAGDAPVPSTGAVVPTRVAGWVRKADPKDKTGQNEWLAIVIVQAAPPGQSGPCSAQSNSLDVIDAGTGCLRLRRNADFDHWMQAAQPMLYRWVDNHGWTSLPRAWAGYRVPSANGGTIEVHVLFTPSLIEPPTRNTVDFMTSGLPGQQWARQLAAAVRGLNGTAGNVFTVPPFPFAPGPRAELEAALPDMLPTTKPAAAASAAAPATAEQVMPVPRPEEPARRRP